MINTQFRQRILAELYLQPLLTRQLAKRLELDDTKLVHDNLYNLIRSGYIERGGSGFYSITDQGKKVLEAHVNNLYLRMFKISNICGTANS